MSTVSQAHCAGCGAAVTGRYCTDCGEHTEPHDYSMKHFVEEVLETVAHVDGRVFASFRSLLTRPGQLAADFLAGRRKAQIGPVQMFVVCNVLYFLFLPLALQVPFTSTLRMQTENRPWRVMAKRMVDAKVSGRHEEIEEYAVHFDETAHLQGHSLVMLMVPLFAIGVWALHPRARRYYAEHLVFSFYAIGLLLLWMTVVTVPISQIPPRRPREMVASERIAARAEPGRADRARIHCLPRQGVRPRLRRPVDRSDREGAAVDRLAGCVSDDLPLHPVFHDVLHNLEEGSCNAQSRHCC